MVAVLERVPLVERTSFRIGGEARFFVEPVDAQQLGAALQWASQRDLPVFVLGGGSNTLIADAGYDGLVISTLALHGIRELPPASDGAPRLTVRSGTPLKRLIHDTLQRGWGGLEHFVGIPGTVGGAVYGNAGSRGHEFGEFVERLCLLDRMGRQSWVPGDQVSWRYRSSGLGEGVVAEVVLRLTPGERAAMTATARELFNLKRRTQPLQEPSAGCVFRNPPGAHAGELIDRLGFKGMRVGGARVSEHHANFIVNEGGARAADVRQLIERIQGAARSRFGVDLVREIVTPKSLSAWPESS